MDSLQELKDLKVAYRRCFESEHGVKVLKDLERRCFIKDMVFDKDPIIMSFNEGTRSVVLHINHMRDAEYGIQPEVERKANG